MIYIFHRKEGWYPLELESDEAAIENAQINPGTERVERLDGSMKDFLEKTFPWITN